MTQQEKRKRTLAAVLAAVLGWLVWDLSREKTAEVTVRSAAREPAAAQTARANGTAVAGVAAIPVPESPEEFCRLDPFRIGVCQRAQDGVGPSGGKEKSEDSVKIPKWLQEGRVSGVLQLGNREAIIVNGRVLRAGDRVEGVEIVRIERDRLWVRPIAGGDGGGTSD